MLTNGGEEDFATVEDTTKGGVALNPDERVTLDNVAKQVCRNSQKRKRNA